MVARNQTWHILRLIESINCIAFDMSKKEDESYNTLS
jgi:hypothetical protein